MRLSSLLLCMVLASAASAAPPLVSYQGILLDPSGAPRNGVAGLELRLFAAPTGGVPLWSEAHAGVPVVDGVFHVLLGSIEPLDAAVAGADDLWLEVAVDGQALAPRQQVVSSFFALRAGAADRLLQSCAEGDILRFRGGAWECTPIGTCLPGQSQACYSGPTGTQNVGQCREGQQTCGALGQPGGACAGEVVPIAELCNSLDDDCDGQTDESFDLSSDPDHCGWCGNACAGGSSCESGSCTPAACDPDGVYLKSGNPITYTCCLGIVELNVSSFTFSSDGARIASGPAGAVLVSPVPATCPVGALDHSSTEPGGCSISHRLVGSFTGTDAWQGTYSLQFTGPDCSCFGGLLGTPCVNQSFPVSATR
jgi:hypothetical protein